MIIGFFGGWRNGVAVDFVRSEKIYSVILHIDKLIFLWYNTNRMFVIRAFE